MENRIIPQAALTEYCARLMMTQGVPEDEAMIIGRHLVAAEMMGVTSHGVNRTMIYLKRLETGVVNPKWDHKILKESAASVQWDACNSMGMVTGVKAMEKCIEKARESGCCFITVNHSNHFGMAGYYARMAAEAGMIGVCGTNAPPNIAPTGSHKPYMGTNPLAVCAPRRGDPILLDMAPSVVALGKIIIAAKLGKSIPEGWALTADGRPTTDPNEAMKGTMMPIGGPKGYGLSFFMDVLCGPLSGAQFGPYLNNMFHDFENPQDLGHIFFAADISHFVDLEEFKDRIEIMAADIKALPKNPGVSEIFLPGEIEVNRRKAAEEAGVPVPESVYNDLAELGKSHGVAVTI